MKEAEKVAYIGRAGETKLDTEITPECREIDVQYITTFALFSFNLDYHRTGNSRILLESSLKRISIKCVHAFIFWTLYKPILPHAVDCVIQEILYTAKGENETSCPPPRDPRSYP